MCGLVCPKHNRRLVDGLPSHRPRGAEPRWVKDHLERVLDAERIMRAGGYEIGSPTERGARRWVPAERPKRFGTLRLFGLKISV